VAQQKIDLQPNFTMSGIEKYFTKLTKEEYDEQKICILS